MTDPNHRPDKPPVIPRHLTSSDLADISQVLEQVLQKTGLTPHPPVDLEVQRKLGLQTLVQQARRLVAAVLRMPDPPSGSINNLVQTIEQVEKEWRL